MTLPVTCRRFGIKQDIKIADLIMFEPPLELRTKAKYFVPHIHPVHKSPNCPDCSEVN